MPLFHTVHSSDILFSYNFKKQVLLFPVLYLQKRKVHITGICLKVVEPGVRFTLSDLVPKAECLWEMGLLGAWHSLLLLVLFGSELEKAKPWACLSTVVHRKCRASS